MTAESGAGATTDLVIQVASPARSWQTRTVAVLVTLAASVLVSLLALVLDVLNWRFWSSGGREGRPALVNAFVRFDPLYGLVLLLVVVAYIGTFAVWHRSTSRVLQAASGRPATGTHWTVIVWRISLIFSLAICGAPGNLLIGPMDIAPSQVAGMTELMSNSVVVSAARLALQVVLLAGVWQRRAQVQESVAATGVTMRFQPEAPRESALIAQAGAQWSAGAGRRADDSFWLAVRDLARTAEADLALLEAAGPFAHRWLIVPASGDVSAVRAGLSPGTRVTVFPQPPSASFAVPADAAPFHGFVDGTYRSVAAPRVPAFLTQAAEAGRYGLYSPHDPNALRATV
jgi:hypothetical protein